MKRNETTDTEKDINKWTHMLSNPLLLTQS